MKILPYILLLIFVNSCGRSDNFNSLSKPSFIGNKLKETPVKLPFHYPKIADRTEIKQQIQDKINANKPLTIHVFVPLCDNKNQGIVPTSPKLGNGMDTENNLYWGVRHGMRTVFKLNPNWKLLKQYNPPDTDVLERVIFTRQYNKTKVTLIADAYRGDKMKECLEEYFNALAENKLDSIRIKNKTYPAFGNSDLLVFNGHNGLMDTEISYEIKNTQIRQKDAISISCSSMYYFDKEYKNTNSYPLVTTQYSLYPGGFILEGIIDKWATQSTDELIRQEAGNSYHRVKKCGLKGARNLFYSGWYEQY